MRKPNSELKKELRRIARGIKVRLRFIKVSDNQFMGLAVEGRKILINRGIRSRDLIISTFFHELAHVICYRSKKFRAFHTFTGVKKGKTKWETFCKLKKAVLSTALRAELYVDRMGEELAREYFPSAKYDRAYRTKYQKQFLYSYLSGWFDSEMRRQFIF